MTRPISQNSWQSKLADGVMFLGDGNLFQQFCLTSFFILQVSADARVQSKRVRRLLKPVSKDQDLIFLGV